MDLKELRYFRSIAQSGTFSKAAAHLRVAQPALSRQLKKLEYELGVELLLRTTKGVSLTPAGKVLLERADEIEALISETRRDLAGLADNLSGSIRVALQYPLSVAITPQLLRRYEEIHPKVMLGVFDTHSAEIIDSLLDSRLDVAIVDPPSHDHSDLTAIPLWTDKLKLIAPASAASLPIFSPPTITMEEIVSLPLVMPSQRSTLRRLVDRAFARRQLEFRPRYEADGQNLNVKLVTLGMAYSIFPKSVFGDAELRGEIISRDIKPSILRTNSIVTRTAMLDDPRMRSLIKLLKEIIPPIISEDVNGPGILYTEAHG